MTTKIFYFSGTGNTLKVAKDIGTAIGETKYIRISYDMDFNQTECDIVGIAYPVYCFGLPNIVAHFIDTATFSPTAYIFGLSTYGLLLTNSGNILRKNLKKRGYTLAAGFAVHMPGNAQMVYELAKDEKRKKLYAMEQKRVDGIASAIKNRTRSKIETNMGILGKAMSLLSPGMMSKINESAKSFFADKNCNGCGICRQVCPVNNISMVNDKPQWSTRCESCLACFHWCPQKAIQASKKTAQRKRYHHPDVTLKEIIVRE